MIILKSILRYFVVSVSGGIVFGALDGIINANSYAQKLFEVYKPITKTSINVPLGLGIDLVYGFVMAGFTFISKPTCCEVEVKSP